VHRRAAQFDLATKEFTCEGTATNARTRFEDHYSPTLGSQFAGGGDTGVTSTNDHDIVGTFVLAVTRFPVRVFLGAADQRD